MLEMIVLIITIRESFLAILFSGYFVMVLLESARMILLHEHLHQHLTLQAIPVLINLQLTNAIIIITLCLCYLRFSKKKLQQSNFPTFCKSLLHDDICSVFRIMYDYFSFTFVFFNISDTTCMGR